MCLEDRRSFACELTSPGYARAFCREYLGPVVGHLAEGRELVGTTELVVTELVTNAIRAGCSGEIVVEFVLHLSVLRVSVQDDAAGHPRVEQPLETDDHGRGLHIIDALVSEWGVAPVDGGKQVWADLAVPVGPTAALHCSWGG